MSLDEILKYYCEKYPNVDANTARSSLLYHNDIDFTVPVMLMDSKLKWKDIESRIKQAVAGHERKSANSKTYLKQEKTNYLGLKKSKDNDRDQGLGM